MGPAQSIQSRPNLGIWAGLTVVLCALGDDDKVTGFDLLLLSTDNCLGDSRGEDEVLVDSVDLQGSGDVSSCARLMRHMTICCSITHLLSDISTDWHGHDDQLRALTGPENRSEVWVLRRQSVDSLQVGHLLRWGRHLALFGSRG